MFKRQRRRFSSTRLRTEAPSCKFKHARYDIRQIAVASVMQLLVLYCRLPKLSHCRQRLCAVLLMSLAQPMGWTCLSSRRLEACELQSKHLASVWSILPCIAVAAARALACDLVTERLQLCAGPCRRVFHHHLTMK